MLVLECAPKRGSTEPLAAPATLSRSDAGGTELAEVLGPLAYFGKALAAPKAQDVIEQIFFGTAKAAGDPRLPSGCLMVQGALAVGDAAESVRKQAAGRRAAGEVAQSGKAIFRKTLIQPNWLVT